MGYVFAFIWGFLLVIAGCIWVIVLIFKAPQIAARNIARREARQAAKQQPAPPVYYIPAPAPAPVYTPPPVPPEELMRRWSMQRKRWEAAEKAEWEKSFALAAKRR